MTCQFECSPDIPDRIIPVAPAPFDRIPDQIFNLPATGMDILVLVGFALLLVLLGTLCVAVARRWL